MINKSKATLSKYENGTITIDIETLYDIAQALNIDLKCFIDYQPPVFHQEQVLTGNFYFNTPQAYMYYFDGRIHQLVRSLLRFFPRRRRRGHRRDPLYGSGELRRSGSMSAPLYRRDEAL